MAEWGTPAERQTRLRILVATAAYAYEIANDPIMPDAQYDSMARQIDPSISTGNETLDEFFEWEFSCHTGMWIHSHPDLEGIRKRYERFYTL